MTSRPRFRPLLTTLAGAALAVVALLLTPGAARAAEADAVPTLRLVAEAERALIVAGDKPSTVHLRVIVTGIEPPAAGATPRLPMNVGLVLDKSGSMNGDDKWGYVRSAVEDAFVRMGVEDYFSLVLYDDNARVVIPPTRHLDADWARRQLDNFGPGGSTALFAGLQLGAAQVAEHLGPRHVPRVILLSDGLANVGPSSPEELRALAERLSGQGVRISTIGVGADYNEDLMLGIAKESGGSYYFIADPKMIPTIFDEELSGLSSVVARDVEIVVELPDGVRCGGSLDKGDAIRQEGRRVTYVLPELSARRSTSLLLQLEVDATAEVEAAVRRALADVQVRWRTADDSAAPRELAEKLEVGLTRDAAAADASANVEVAAEVLRFQMVANREAALQAMDAGRAEEAQALWASNSALLQDAPAAVQAAPAVQTQLQETESDKQGYETKDETARKAAQYSIYRNKK